jgi:hypothetical protein
VITFPGLPMDPLHMVLLANCTCKRAHSPFSLEVCHELHEIINCNKISLCRTLGMMSINDK